MDRHSGRRGWGGFLARGPSHRAPSRDWAVSVPKRADHRWRPSVMAWGRWKHPGPCSKDAVLLRDRGPRAGGGAEDRQKRACHADRRGAPMKNGHCRQGACVNGKRGTGTRRGARLGSAGERPAAGTHGPAPGFAGASQPASALIEPPG